jgi:hypothetical protein
MIVLIILDILIYFFTKIIDFIMSKRYIDVLLFFILILSIFNINNNNLL